MLVPLIGQGQHRACRAEASFGAEAHAEAATALAELYVHLGQPAAALEILYSLQGVGAVLSPHSPAVWPLHWRRASLFMKLGHTVRSTARCLERTTLAPCHAQLATAFWP